MTKKITKTVVKKRVIKDKNQDKVRHVMTEFKDGTLKDSAGNIVTDRNQALAIALSEAGLSRKSLMKAEIKNKLRVYKSVLEDMLTKELDSDREIKKRIIEFFIMNKNPNDDQVHELAEQLKLRPDEIENYIYSMFSSFIAGGISKGKKNEVDPEQLKKGIKIEMEHTDDPLIAEKIARDHITEDPIYYDKLEKIESKKN